MNQSGPDSVSWVCRAGISDTMELGNINQSSQIQ